MADRVCAIHQPNFFPWLGYFDKIRKCDIFVVLDDAQLPKEGKGNWSNRVAVIVQGKKNWLTAPIERGHGIRNIRDSRFCETDWRKTIRKTLQMNYARAARFRELQETIFDLVAFPSNNLVEYNLNAVAKLCAMVNIEFQPKAVLSSNLSIASTGTQRLIDICAAVGCNTYLSGDGADGYQDIDLFRRSNINLVFQQFAHPVYRQFDDRPFIPGLSVIDYLFHSREV